MDNKKFPANFNLERFCESFVRNALVAGNMGLTFGEFDKKVFVDVASENGLSIGAVKHLHHCFYWALFPNFLSAYQIKPTDTEQHIFLLRNPSDEQIRDYARGILGSQKSYLDARIARFNELADAA